MKGLLAVLLMGLVVSVADAAPLPTDNPIAAFYASNPQAVPGWVGKLSWDRVVSIADFHGQDDDSRLAAAQATLRGKGGVIYFPPGTYTFKQHIDFHDGVILRGRAPASGSAKDEKYTLATRFQFPK